MCNRVYRQLLVCVQIVGGVIFPVLLHVGEAEAQNLRWWTTHGLAKIRPGDDPPTHPSRAVELFAGRNEFESFQIVLRTDSRNVDEVDVQVSDLLEPSGSAIRSDKITIYLERYLKFSSASSADGDAGEWPDPLIPRVDRYAGERRNAFPFRLGHGRNQPLWIEIFIPPHTIPGTYSGKAMITVRGLPNVAIPITLHVWDFDLPSTSSLQTSFGLSGPAALKQHRGRYTSDNELDSITYLYAKAALWHRISIHGGAMAAPPYSGNGRIDWGRYNREVGPFLDGTVFGENEPLFGARSTSVDLRTLQSVDSPEKKISYWREWVRHFSEKGWLDRLFYYVWDEPAAQSFPQVAAQAELAHRADARIRNLVTTSQDESLESVIDIWAPLINCLDSKPGFPDYCERTAHRDAYEAELQEGKSLWWYQSCASHGCKLSRGDYFRGWPSYVVDVTAVANRIMPWLAWKYRVEGELYFSMNEAFSRNRDPWNDIHLFGGNGDGTLFYPGRPNQIGGSTDIPIESIRLKLIREGLEDYEYLVLLARKGQSDIADEAISRMVTTVYEWNKDPAILYQIRREIGERLGGGGVPAITTTDTAQRDTNGEVPPAVSLPSGE